MKRFRPSGTISYRQKKGDTMKFIRRKEVENRTGLSRSSIYKRMSEGTFPKQQKIGQRAVAWVEDDVNKWMCSCISEI